jgi:hypothetical protein
MLVEPAGITAFNKLEGVMPLTVATGVRRFSKTSSQGLQGFNLVRPLLPTTLRQVLRNQRRHSESTMKHLMPVSAQSPAGL